MIGKDWNIKGSFLLTVSATGDKEEVQLVRTHHVAPCYAETVKDLEYLTGLSKILAYESTHQVGARNEWKIEVFFYNSVGYPDFDMSKPNLAFSVCTDYHSRMHSEEYDIEKGKQQAELEVVILEALQTAAETKSR